MIKLDEVTENMFVKATETWGDDAQWAMAIGECGEFVTLEGLRVQGRLTDEKVIDEIADVIIMMLQMRKRFGEGAVDERIKYKLNRLHGKLYGYWMQEISPNKGEIFKMKMVDT